MCVVYDRPQRLSIYHIATIGDFPFEVIQRIFRLFEKKGELADSSLVCRAWHQAAKEVLLSRISFYRHRRMEWFFCGMQLKTIVSGFDRYSIKRLKLDMSSLGRGYARVMAQVVSPTLSSLSLRWDDDEDTEEVKCYEILDIFLAQCIWINTIYLEEFDFGIYSTSITSKIKNGFSRIQFLSLIRCHGDLAMFVDQIPVLNLCSFRYTECDYPRIDVNVIISMMARKSRSLKSVLFDANFPIVGEYSNPCQSLSRSSGNFSL
jgi:hypothetical protein